jgi:hypothetical protein
MHCAHQSRVVRQSPELVHEPFQPHPLDAVEYFPDVRPDI